MDEPKTSFTDTLKTWHEDAGTTKPEAVRSTIEFKPTAPASTAPPMPETPMREFADHMDRAQQAVKDWVRKELHLHAHGVSLPDRIKANP